MKNMRTLILEKYNRRLVNAATPAEKERIKGKIYNFLQRCQKHDRERDRRNRIYWP